MFIHYDPATLAPWHIVTLAPEEYATWARARGETFVEAESMDPGEVELVREADAVICKRRARFALVAPGAVAVGEAFEIKGVPAGLSIYENDELLGVADGTPIEVTLSTAAIYRFRFEGPGYVTQEVRIEARA